MKTQVSALGRRIDLNLVLAFEAIYRCRNLTAAGREIGLTQSAMSHALGRLRTSFADPLFVRSGGALHPTPVAEDIAPAFESFKGRAEALYVCNDPLVNSHRIRINTLALGMGLPTMYNVREFVEAGGLMSYGPNFPDLYRRAAGIVDKILHGAKPADIPVEQPTKFDLVINLTTAKALGLKVPDAFLLRADEVIE